MKGPAAIVHSNKENTERAVPFIVCESTYNNKRHCFQKKKTKKLVFSADSINKKYTECKEYDYFVTNSIKTGFTKKDGAYTPPCKR